MAQINADGGALVSVSMADLIEQLEQAVDLFLQGRIEEAADMGGSLLARSRGTPHAAAVHRHQAEFLHSLGNYDAALQMAQEAGNLARATRHPSEILAATLCVFNCDLYRGRVSAVHQQITELMELTPQQPMPLSFMARLMLLVGNFEQALELSEQTRTLLSEVEQPQSHPMIALAKANQLLLEAKTLFLQQQPFFKRVEPVLEMELISQIPNILAKAMHGLTLVLDMEVDLGCEYLVQAVNRARKVSANLHGLCLALSGQAFLHLNELALATEQLRYAIGLLVHPLEKQEYFYTLGLIARSAEQDTQAEQAFRQAAYPSTETHFGRLAVQALHNLVGLRPL